MTDMTNMTLEQASELAQQLKTEIGKAVIGQKQVIHETLIALIAGGNVPSYPRPAGDCQKLH